MHRRSLLIPVLALVIGWWIQSNAVGATGLVLGLISPRAAGEAGAFTAASEGIDSLAVNPAGIAGITGRQAAFAAATVARKVPGLQLSSVFRIPGVGPFGVRLGYLWRAEKATPRFSEFLFSAAWAYRLKKILDAGISAGAVATTLGSEHSASLVMNIGCRSTFVLPRLVAENRLSAGICLKNIVTSGKFARQAAGLNDWLVIGGSWTAGRLTLAADSRIPLSDGRGPLYAAGVEYAFPAQVRLTGGVEFDSPQTRFDFGISFGVRVARAAANLDYAFNPVSATGGTGHRAGVTAGF